MSAFIPPQQYQAHHHRFIFCPTLLLYPSLALQPQDRDLGCSFIFPLDLHSGLVTGFPSLPPLPWCHLECPSSPWSDLSDDAQCYEGCGSLPGTLNCQ